MPDAPSPLEPATSPLTEADPTSINEMIQERVNEIFNKPPLSLTDDDLRIAVEYYRRERARFILESQNKVPRAVAKRKAAPKSVAEAMAANADLL